MLKRINESNRQRLGNLILAALAVAVVAAAWGTAVRVHDSILEGREQVRVAGQLIAKSLDHELDVHVSYLNAMSYQAERSLSGHAPTLDNPIERLKRTAKGDGFESDLPPGFGDHQHLGRFTGLGPVPGINDPIKQEMQMVVSLTPLMRAIKERGDHIPWIHYASARGFMFIFPYRGSENFFFNEQLLKRDYFAKATPEANPERHVHWSQPYTDAAGQGEIVTITKPVYQGDHFLGSLNIDFKLESLRQFLRGVPIPKTHIHITKNPEGQTILQAWAHEDDVGKPHDRIVLPLSNAPWAVELTIDEGALLAASLQGRMWHLMAVIALAVTFLFLLMLTRSHRLARNLAITDGLTGLHNRRYFDAMAGQQFELVRRKHLTTGLILLDIDFFKKYNDHYGHQQGDVALKAVAGAIRKALRREVDQVFRVGGEEFAALLPLNSPSELPVMMERINQEVRDLALEHVGNPSGRMTVSIGGVCIAGNRWMPVSEAYKVADDALYRAKTSGRDRAVVAEPIAN
ncbi:diguanylate cyclase [Aquabacterium sp.]|uniref:sensor domain-containing diguanylate cyclase n=1 Tax=Aquabacterium sp. TaxID=1872578 RepID=UPI002E32BFDF|nr:diguanylate cyclase [Aquabacterium sp.]HEX5312366.1 diguanylate cyclase [Aquabacterium sp.]